MTVALKKWIPYFTILDALEEVFSLPKLSVVLSVFF